MIVDRATFERDVQDALDHLYDPAYLLGHPLAALLTSQGAEPPQRALHRILRDAIQTLKPPADAPAHSPAWRLYRYLSLRYVEMLTISQVAAELGISPRQCRRDHHEAIAAICSILWKQYVHGSADSPSRRAGTIEGMASDGPLEAELGKIGAASAPTATSLAPVVEGVTATLSALAARRQVQLRVMTPLDVPPVAVERAALRQILLEMLLEAIDRGAGGEVSMAAVGDASQVRFDIVARPAAGSGLPWPIDRAQEDARLAVSRRLADLQGATLAVEQRADAYVIQLALPTAETPTVLVVDDNADVLSLFRRYLDKLYDVHAAASGEEALRLAVEVHPAIITLDVMMPAQDGWEVLQTLKHDPATARIPVIVCSVLRERELALSLGAADFLAKPITAEDLRAALQRWATPS